MLWAAPMLAEDDYVCSVGGECGEHGECGECSASRSIITFTCTSDLSEIARRGWTSSEMTSVELEHVRGNCRALWGRR